MNVITWTRQRDTNNLNIYSAKLLTGKDFDNFVTWSPMVWNWSEMTQQLRQKKMTADVTYIFPQAAVTSTAAWIFESYSKAVTSV